MIKTNDEEAITMNRYFISLIWDKCSEGELLFIVKDLLATAKDHDLNVQWIIEELNKTKINGRINKSTTSYKLD
jgi:hypothetical protein